jgi:hypothetical protein
MGTTTRYSIPYPESTDFVAQGAAAIEAVATGFDSIVYGIQVGMINARTGTSYSYQPVLSDAGKLITMEGTGPLTLSVPFNGTVPYEIGTRIDVLQLSAAGPIVIFPVGGVTVHAKDGKLELDNQFSAATIIKIAANTWVAVGDLT